MEGKPKKAYSDYINYCMAELQKALAKKSYTNISIFYHYHVHSWKNVTQA